MDSVCIPFGLHLDSQKKGTELKGKEKKRIEKNRKEKRESRAEAHPREVGTAHAPAG